MDHQPAAPSADDLFAEADQSCQACGMVSCQCVRPDGLLGALAALPQPQDPPPPDPDFLKLLAQIYSSPALGGMLNRRVDQAVKHGHTPAADLLRSPYAIARACRDRVDGAIERLSGREPNRERLEIALRYAETAGAVAMALHDRIRAALAEMPDGNQ